MAAVHLSSHKNKLGGKPVKRIIILGAFTLCTLFIIFSQPAMSAAQEALSLWWNAVLPTLFPFFVCATLIERTGALTSLANFLQPLSKRLGISCYALPVLLLGGVSGYPSGARLSGMLLENHTISPQEAQRLGTVCNLCSPMFLMGALCAGMLQNTGLFALFCIAHYGSALLVAIGLHLLAPLSHSLPARISRDYAIPFHKALPAALSDGIFGLIKVGGSIIFFLVLAQLLKETKVLFLLALPLQGISPALAQAIPGFFCGLLEMTGGCHLLSQAEIPLRLSVSLCAFLVSFGGLCVMTQAMAFLEYPHPGRYLASKAAQGLLAGLLAWFLLPLFPGAAPTMAIPETPYMANALSGLSMLMASALGMAVAMLLAVFARKSSHKRQSRKQ